MPTKRMLIAALIAAPLTGPARRALAHGPTRGPNGGQMQDIGSFHGELVARDGSLTFFFYDANDRPLPIDGVAATAVVLSGGRQQTIAFAPRSDGKAMVASGDFRADPALRVVLQLVPAPGQPRLQARYAPVGADR